MAKSSSHAVGWRALWRVHVEHQGKPSSKASPAASLCQKVFGSSNCLRTRKNPELPCSDCPQT